MPQKTYAMVIHRIFNGDVVKKGGADFIAGFLESNGYSHFLIENPLIGTHATVITYPNGDKKTIELPGRGPVHWLCEILASIYFLTKQNNLDLIIAVDPLNFIPALLHKLIFGTRILYHSIDYSDARFSNKLLNAVYQSSYRFAVRNADIVSYVSKIMGTRINEIVGENHKNVIYYLPNSPAFANCLRIKPSEKAVKSIVFTKSEIDDADAGVLAYIVRKLSEAHVNCKFVIIGGLSAGATKEIDLVRSTNIVETSGLISNEKNDALVAHAYIGFAWYHGIRPFEKYGDSLKLRAYVASGLPCVANGLAGTCREMVEEGAGIPVETPDEAVEALTLLLTNKDKYDQYRAGALRWAQKTDKTLLLEGLLKYV
jgi:glycosyltransferase involved in cell wall biosynthesis